ncbi:hypothetical protein BC477_01925 [Clavibacter michiganensis subsp. michiganensis]|uniref:Uncharacterized protein n=1 Tax=Clavibacter michiganensis subsp. michiganensis TaxID=33013 RepID=A0A251XJ65_CLAMM|nr:hypothetical protein BC477_01925 [Clavibacter michiganensis subsp. michiganensis]OUE03467.1 hypothetical protein CMMCAS07_00860 [Clavibacter michiganensis subsp. michiganensis]
MRRSSARASRSVAASGSTESPSVRKRSTWIVSGTAFASSDGIESWPRTPSMVARASESMPMWRAPNAPGANAEDSSAMSGAAAGPGWPGACRRRRRSLATSATYSSWLRSVGRASKRTFTSQPAPNGSLLTRSGEATTSSLTSVTVPSMGAKSSPTDLVDSISPTTSPPASSSPTAGSSTKTTSPSLSAA